MKSIKAQILTGIKEAFKAALFLFLTLGASLFLPWKVFPGHTFIVFGIVFAAITVKWVRTGAVTIGTTNFRRIPRVEFPVQYWVHVICTGLSAACCCLSVPQTPWLTISGFALIVVQILFAFVN